MPPFLLCLIALVDAIIDSGQVLVAIKPGLPRIWVIIAGGLASVGSFSQLMSDLFKVCKFFVKCCPKSTFTICQLYSLLYEKDARVNVVYQEHKCGAVLRI